MAGQSQSRKDASSIAVVQQNRQHGPEEAKSNEIFKGYRFSGEIYCE
jgi:hypothetical protein